MHARKRQPEALPEEGVLEILLTRGVELVRRHARLILIVVAALLACMLAYQNYRNKARSELAASWEELSSLPAAGDAFVRPEYSAAVRRQIIERCTDILESRWKTDATPWVLLRLANAQQSSGLLQDALKTYRRLQAEYPRHYATNMASAGLAAVLEGTGRFADAAGAYEELARQEGKGSSLWLDAGRAWELAGNREGAADAYQELTAAPERAVEDDLTRASYRLRDLAGGGPMLSPPPPPPVLELIDDTPIYQLIEVPEEETPIYEPAEVPEEETPIHEGPKEPEPPATPAEAAPVDENPQGLP